MQPFGCMSRIDSTGTLVPEPSAVRTLDAPYHERNLPSVDHGKKKSARAASQKKPSLGWVIALAAAGGAIIGSAATHFISRPQAAPKQSVSPILGEIPQAQTGAVSPQQQQQQPFTPAPQPPGEAPPGKVWSVEHGHWHDAPATPTIPTPSTETPAPASAPPPAEKKE